MKYFKTENGEIRAIDAGKESLIEPQWQELTADQLATELAPTAEQVKAAGIAKIEARLKEIDALSIRPLRAVAAGTAEQFDTDKLKALEAEREQLALDLAALNAG